LAMLILAEFICQCLLNSRHNRVTGKTREVFGSALVTSY